MTESLRAAMSNLDTFGVMAITLAITGTISIAAARQTIRLAAPWAAQFRAAIRSTLNYDSLPLLLLIGLFGVYIALPVESLWYDEAYTAALVSLPPGDMITATAGDVHPPGYYLTVALLTRIAGHSEWGLRLLSAFAGAAAVALVYLLSRNYSDKRQSLLAAAVAALLPGLLYYSHEARPYALLAALLLLMLWAALQERLLLVTLAGALALYTHNYALLYIAALALVMYRDRRVLLALAGAVAIWLPWCLVLISQVSAIMTGGFWMPPPTLSRIITEPLLTLITGFRSPGAITLLALTGVLALTTASVARAWRRPAGQIFVIWLIVPVALAAILSLITPIFLPRGFIAGAYTLPIVWVAYIGDRPRARLALIAAVAMLAGWYVIPANNQRADLRSISDTLDIPTDAIVYHEDIESYLLMSYYIPQAAHRLRPYPASLAHGLSAQTQAAIGVHHASHQAANWYVASGDGPAPEDCQTAYDLGFKWGCVYVR